MATRALILFCAYTARLCCQLNRCANHFGSQRFALSGKQKYLLMVHGRYKSCRAFSYKKEILTSTIEAILSMRLKRCRKNRQEALIE